MTFSFTSLPQFSLGVLALGFASLTATADIALWKFDEPQGAGLSDAVDSAGGISFDGGATGIRTNGEGSLEVRRSLGTSIVRNAALGPITSGRVWMELDIEGWRLDGEPTEELSFGFSREPDLEEVAASLEWKRLSQSNVWIHGIAEGEGSTGAALDEFFPRNQSEPLRFVLECDLDRSTYEIYRQGARGEWLSAARGAIAEDAEINYFGLRFANRFNDSSEEFLNIDRIAVTRKDPIDRSRWTAMADHPFVTAWSWAVGDARTGEILASHEVDAPRKSASVTKAMTTYIVCEMAKRDPSILKEMLVFSELALRARGSSAHIEEGESLPIRDALYAFMLPSGNAVGNALAEHFNDRFAPPVDARTGGDPHLRANFIAEMNRTAARLGMHDTVYRSAYGDGGSLEDRTTTARDMMTLARAVMRNELFRNVVGTKEYSAEVTMVNGAGRTGSWTNTNQFLGQEGYRGIKTGTTSTARACLLSHAVLNDRPLYGIVLGSNHSSRRYVDTRNLLNWAAGLE